ncbi:uncharacterized protein SPPG_04828 [Spizellomyces punctatus DAOM BR117]|uniref:Arf-GAP with coiled-coil, ANK repeat and PH domain-containing protein n=1 Tax=Spizellomyces punctatus (strain DAOM BR117) TaxID=645134 RepID=A0A0L0HHC7_SPIPD|nr:uncharacterized protein SPPG_04828 [Spizellomyces punctatus DAOM BR117]KND00518.1 hypothetical protein SPPG_04828 [Spizellomyces punctatus DAOM BR117]|eukprot:XP_016608557.1 hypothetical protein SPPG_04828 [Spizellomyces punctatus DAOM BR117]
MVRPVPLEEAFGDSPAFHSRLQASETALNDADSSIKKMVAIAEKLSDLTKEYSAKYQQLAEEIQNLAGKDDDPAYEAVGQQLTKFAQVIKDIERSRLIAASQYKDVFVDPLNQFIASEVQPTKKAGKDFQHAQDQYQNALSRYMSKKSTDKGIEESARDAADARKAFHTKTIEYATKLNDVDVKRKFEIVENVVALVYTNFSFFHQAYDALKDLEPSMRDLTGILQKMRADYSKIDTKASAEFILHQVKPEDYDPSSPTSVKATRTASTLYKGGYLFKKSSSKMRTVWHRRYFELMNNFLHYFSLEGKDEAKTTIDLRICAVKETPNPERRFCFDLVSPNKALTLQAQSEDQMKDWMSVLQAAISRSISDEGFVTSPVKPTFGEMDQAAIAKREGNKSANEFMKQVHAIPGNNVCADCASQEDVEWASCNLGIILCITCSGIHRGLGRHVSKMKSLALDRWDQESGDILLALGNEKVNAIFEGKLRKEGQLDAVKPKPNAERAAKQKYCVAKYANKEYLLSPDTDPTLRNEPLQSAFVNAVKNGDILTSLRCIAYGANVNEVDLTGQTMLHKVTLRSDAMVAEFLLQWNAEINGLDQRGRTPLHCAAEAGNANTVLALLRRNAKTDIRDNDGKLAIDVAVENSTKSESHVRIVTILRLTSLDNENKASSTWRAQDWGIHEALQHLSSPSLDAQSEAVEKVGVVENIGWGGGGTSPITVPPADPAAWGAKPALAASDPWAEEQNAWAK